MRLSWFTINLLSDLGDTSAQRLLHAYDSGRLSVGMWANVASHGCLLPVLRTRKAV